MKTYAIIMMFLSIAFIIGCTPDTIGDKPVQANAFLVHLQSLNHSGYIISENSSYASSGGGSSINAQRELSSDELSTIISDLENISPAASFMASDSECYYSSGGPPIYYVCFSEDRIVDYGKYTGPSHIMWNVPSHAPALRTALFNQVSDLQSCNADSDCELVIAGVCDINGSLSIDIPGYDNGCRAALNKDHAFIWEWGNFIEDTCINGTCISQGNDTGKGFVASCQEGKCVAVTPTNSVTPIN